MKVVSMSVYKEAKQHKKFQERIRQEKVKRLKERANKAIYELDQHEFQELTEIIYDGSKEEIGEKMNELIFKGGVNEGIDYLVEMI